MHLEWKEFEWRNLASLEYGKSLRKYQKSKGRFPVYGTNGLIGWHDKPLCNSDGVIIGRKGAYRGVHYSRLPFFVIDTAFYLKPKIRDLYIRFAYYELLTHDINTMDSGSAIPSTSRSDFYSLKVTLPPLWEQQAIAHILGTLDDKIELNQQMNNTLESIGQAIFKHWFVDYEFPNEVGKPYKSSGGEIDSSDFGEKPHGWETKPFSEVIAVNPLREMKSNEDATKVEMSDLNLWQPWIDSWSIDKYKSGSRFKNGDTLFARITPCLENGKTALVSFLGENEVAFGSTEFIVLSPKSIHSSYYILYLATSRELRGSAILSMTGSSGRQRVPNDFFDYFAVVVPPDGLLRRFDSFVAPMFEKITNNARESRTLKTIRDSLLPRLMSGRIRVPLNKKDEMSC